MSSLHYSGPSRFYKELAELPAPSSAKFVNRADTSGVSVVRVAYSVRDHERNVKRSVTKTFTLAAPDAVTVSPVISSVVSQDSAEIADILYSPSEKHHALLREVPDANGGKKRYVEVWSGAKLEASLEVTQRHGQFHTDDCLRSFSFSPSETALVYAAEANPVTSEERGDNPYPKFRFVPSFGEQLYTKKQPALFLFRWITSTGNGDATPAASLTELLLDQAPNIPTVFGQAIFATETLLYATGYEQTDDGKLLGLRACFNRPTSVWELILPEENSEKATTAVCKSVKVSSPERAARSPRVLFNKDRVATALFWLSNPRGGAHASTVSLHVRNLKGGASDRVLVDAVYDPAPQEFPGLYTEFNLNDSPFLRLGEKTYVVAQSLWRARPTVVAIDAESGAVTDLTPVLDGQALHSWSLIGTDGGRSAICSRSTPTSPPETVLLTLMPNSSPNVWVLDRPTISSKLQEAIDGLEASIIPIPERHPVETIVIRSKGSAQGQKPICLTILHGGPHASCVTSFTPNVLAYALEGYTISMPNYTGSMGYGEKYIQKLIGKCGTLDVADCIATVEELVKRGLSESGRQIVQGGSHGGFLTAHLIGQYPDVFTAAAMRNPVISAGEFCTSDITDWSFFEFGLPFGPGTHVTPDSFSTLYAASPIAHVDRVKTPVLIMLGEEDLRVPPTQGRGYYHVLKSKGRVVELLVFPKEVHSLDGVEAARVSFEAIRDWFKVFTSKE